MSFPFSYWEKKNFFNADVIIVGSGIVGLNAAITIKTKNPKIAVLVLERGFLPAGASTKSAGFACFGSISELIEQEKLSGSDGLHRLLAKRWNGLLKLKKLLGNNNIGFEHFGGYELFKYNDVFLSAQCVSKISHFNSLIADIVNKKNTYCLSSQKVREFGFKDVDALIECKLEAQIDPGKMMKALIAKSNALGVLLLNNCKVLNIEEANSDVNIKTSQGDFTCKKVLLTNNAFVNELFPKMDVVPGRGQVIVTNPITNLKLKGTFHYNKGFYYFRNIGDRILLGGGRNLDFKTETTTEFGVTDVVQEALVNLLKEIIIPGTDFEIEHKWSGIMAFGSQLAPIIEEVKPNVFCAVRCNGMGIAIGSSTGEEAGEMVVESF